jgi:hypothetical protein
MAVMSALFTGCHIIPGRFLVPFSVSGWVDPRAMVWLEGLGQLKNPMTSLGIEPVTFRLVVKCLNQLCYYVHSKLKEFHTELGIPSYCIDLESYKSCVVNATLLYKYCAFGCFYGYVKWAHSYLSTRKYHVTFSGIHCILECSLVLTRVFFGVCNFQYTY